jgi:mannan endo-1,4-beta-mannosidase
MKRSLKRISTMQHYAMHHYALIFMLSAALLPACDKNAISAAATRSTTAEQTQPQTVTPQLSLGLGDGVNLQPSYYNSGNVNFGWSLMKSNTKIKTVRIEIEPTVSITTVKSWISQARSNGFSVIATYHKASVLGSDNVSDLLAAANWWKANYSSLASAGTFTVNLMNEWGDHNLTASAYASAYNQAIPIVRKVYSGIIIDCSGWGQETHIAAEAILGTGGTKISDGNIIPSVHVYPNGWNQALNHNLQNSDLDDLATAGKGGIIGEFGNSPSGSVNWSGIVTYAKSSKGWTVLGWAWNGDGGSMNMVTPSWSSDPTATSFSESSYFNTVYSLL